MYIKLNLTHHNCLKMYKTNTNPHSLMGHPVHFMRKIFLYRLSKKKRKFDFFWILWDSNPQTQLWTQIADFRVFLVTAKYHSELLHSKWCTGPPHPPTLGFSSLKCPHYVPTQGSYSENSHPCPTSELYEFSRFCISVFVTSEL